MEFELIGLSNVDFPIPKPVSIGVFLSYVVGDSMFTKLFTTPDQAIAGLYNS